MAKEKRFGGWHRLWIILSAVYLVAVIAVVASAFPESRRGLSHSERYRLTVELIEEYLEENPDFRQQPPVIRSEYGAIPELTPPPGFVLDDVPFEYFQEMARIRSKYKGRVDFSTVERAYSSRHWGPEHLRFIGEAFLVWFVPVALVYILGLIARWVYNGFKQN